MKSQNEKSILALVATLFGFFAMAQGSDEEVETGERERVVPIGTADQLFVPERGSWGCAESGRLDGLYGSS